MKVKVLWASLLLVAAAAFVPPAGARWQERIQIQRPPLQHVDLAQRELKAPPQIKARLADLRQTIQARKFTFQVGYTRAMDFPLQQLTGDIIPPNIQQIARARNTQAEQLLKLDRAALSEFTRVHPGKLPELTLSCNANSNAFDWRRLGKVTPVRDQSGCGSCWSFAVIAALESSYLIRNTSTTDQSEQFVLANSGAGSCAGGNRAAANAFLVSAGTAAESAIPYTGTNGPANPGAATPYDAVATGFVDAGVENPSVAQLKQALCQYGPLSVSVNATPAFQAYTSGVFNEGANDTTNHAVLLIGWDDSKGAWLIKNSWGAGWGETGGHGTERGYMWIAYNSNRVGRWAQWIRAKSTFYKLPAEYFRAIKLQPAL